MPSPRTPRQEIDRKLHRIVLESDSSLYPTATSIGRALKEGKTVEFSYQRGGGTQFSSPGSIARYVLYAREIGLLDGSFDSTIPKSKIRQIDNFQGWLADSIMDYLKGKNSSIGQIEDTLSALLSRAPYELPTFDNLYSHLREPPPKDYLRLSLRVLALLRPAIIALKSYRLIALPALIRVAP
jgi:hypothetical protein